MIGLSGLITPSLDEMAYNAKRDDASSFRYSTPYRRRNDEQSPYGRQNRPGLLRAGRARDGRVVGRERRPAIIEQRRKARFVEKVRHQQQQSREAYEGKKTLKKLLPLEAARKRRTPIDWQTSERATPSFLGTRVIDDQPLSDLVPVIDWSPFSIRGS